LDRFAGDVQAVAREHVSSSSSVDGAYAGRGCASQAAMTNASCLIAIFHYFPFEALRELQNCRQSSVF
jgi:hypothetical protein